jgi:hypothetical protein
VPGWVAQVHDERVKVVGQASGGGEAGLVELVDQRLESVFGIAVADRVEAQHDLQVHRDDKNVPMTTSCCPTSAESPARGCAVRGSVVRLGW